MGAAILQLSPRCAQRVKYSTGAPFTLLSVTGDVSTLYANPDEKAHWRKVMNASTQWKAADENITTLLKKRAEKQNRVEPDKSKFDLDSAASCYLMVDTINKTANDGEGEIADRTAYVSLLEQLTARLSEKMPTLAIKTAGGRRSTLDEDPAGAASSMAAVSQVSASQLLHSFCFLHHRAEATKAACPSFYFQYTLAPLQPHAQIHLSQMVMLGGTKTLLIDIRDRELLYTASEFEVVAHGNELQPGEVEVRNNRRSGRGFPLFTSGGAQQDVASTARRLQPQSNATRDLENPLPAAVEDQQIQAAAPAITNSSATNEPGVVTTSRKNQKEKDFIKRLIERHKEKPAKGREEIVMLGLKRCDCDSSISPARIMSFMLLVYSSYHPFAFFLIRPLSSCPLSHFSRIFSSATVFDEFCVKLQAQGMTETFDAMTLVYLAELLLGDGHICTSGETIDNQLNDPLPLYKALEDALKRGRVMENATGSTIPRATPELIDVTIHYVVNQVFKHAFQLLPKKGGDTTEAVKEKSCQEFFGKRIDAMITFFRQILLSDNVFYLHLSSDMSKANGLIKSIVKLDNLPARTSKEGLDLLVSAWCDYDVAVCYARFYKRLTKLSFFVRLLLGWLVIVGATLAGRSTTIVGLEQEYVAGTKVIFEVCFVLSLLIGVLVSLEGYFHSKARWRQLRSSAGALESEIWRYRTRSGIYKETARAHFSERPEVIFCIRVNEWRDDLVSSGDLQLTDLERRFATKSSRFLWGHRLWGCLPWGRSVYTKGQFEGFFLKGSGVIDVDSVPRVVRARTERERKEREREDKAKCSRDTAMEEAKQVRRSDCHHMQCTVCNRDY